MMQVQQHSTTKYSIPYTRPVLLPQVRKSEDELLLLFKIIWLQSVFYNFSIQRVSLQNRVIMAICQLSQLSALDNLDGVQWVGIIPKRNLQFAILCIFTRCIHSSSVVLWMRVEVAVLRAVMYCSRNFHSHQNNSADLSGYSSAVECGSIFNYHISEWFLPLNSFIP